MVHALEITRSLLKPDGLLIDIHPTGDPPFVEVHVDGEVRLAGYLEETDNFVEYLEADDALTNVTRRGLFEFVRIRARRAFFVHDARPNYRGLGRLS
jgi:hypothetical protein